ncbi:hypothetical protein [Mycoplasmopsis cynos]|uniref:hypothetical protein n=1 Tax=Mycoplasmopsis cynos TaxID=171284 RepID=UPI002208B033|nr:hypothetical protein [Mycoplasmopsis cynos]UWV81634.1 hypothetical protein NW065_00425 [Mycoplasmopsis cynos]WAM03618.1 hypothetical protein ONA22_00915 [Mycoplasmopsis cynos]WAM04350.1 hypothetical protein ONA01_04925 [Mycoplasmopsis cynos]
MIKSDELNENLLNKNPKLNFVINVKFDQQKILQKLKSNTLIFAKIQELSITDSELLKYIASNFKLRKRTKKCYWRNLWNNYFKRTKQNKIL